MSNSQTLSVVSDRLLPYPCKFVFYKHHFRRHFLQSRASLRIFWAQNKNTFRHNTYTQRIWDSIVAIANWLRFRRSGYLLLAEEKVLFAAKLPDRIWGPTILLLNGYRGGRDHSAVLNRPECEANHSLPTRVKAKNDWSCTPRPPPCVFTDKEFIFLPLTNSQS
jgi:hypothetical protein